MSFIPSIVGVVLIQRNSKMNEALWQKIKEMDSPFNNPLLDSKFKGFLAGEGNSWKFDIVKLVDGKMLVVTPWDKLAEMLNTTEDENYNRNKQVSNPNN